MSRIEALKHREIFFRNNNKKLCRTSGNVTVLGIDIREDPEDLIYVNYNDIVNKTIIPD